MQPFDALTMKAVLEELKPGLLGNGKKVYGIKQLSRDEIILSLRGRDTGVDLLLSAHTQFGRICQVPPSLEKKNQKKEMSPFLLILQKTLVGATLVGIEYLLPDRVIDLVFSALDQFGKASLKTLTAEIMGRYSNLILWDRENKTILAVAHSVTEAMSRRRTLLPGLIYERPPIQRKESIFSLEKDQLIIDLKKSGGSFSPKRPLFEEAIEEQHIEEEITDWLVSQYSGLGKSFARELVALSLLSIRDQVLRENSFAQIFEELWKNLERFIQAKHFQPAYKLDLSQYTLFLENQRALQADKEIWQALPTVNQLVFAYYQQAKMHGQLSQQKENLNKELLLQEQKSQKRIIAASQHNSLEEMGHSKLYGDLILLNLKHIEFGQKELVCLNEFSDDREAVIIPLDENLSGPDNAQIFYRKYSKARRRKEMSEITLAEETNKLNEIRAQLNKLSMVRSEAELLVLTEHLLPFLPNMDKAVNRQIDSNISKNPRNSKSLKHTKAKFSPKKAPVLKLFSTEGWTIYVGRNQNENDRLLRDLAKPQDIWLHLLGISGPHVLIKVPSSKQEPSLNTLQEAAYLAFRFSKLHKSNANNKVRVAYTQCRFVKKIPGESLGLVQYEHEKTIEVDQAKSMPELLRQINSKEQKNS